jgi:hypothetical protein
MLYQVTPKNVLNTGQVAEDVSTGLVPVVTGMSQGTQNNQQSTSTTPPKVQPRYPNLSGGTVKNTLQPTLPNSSKVRPRSSKIGLNNSKDTQQFGKFQ